MFGQNLRVDAPNRQLAVLVGVSILMAVHSFGIQTNLTTALVANSSVDRATVATHPALDELHSGIHDSQTLQLAPEEPPPLVTDPRLDFKVKRFMGSNFHTIKKRSHSPLMTAPGPTTHQKYWTFSSNTM